ncbi:hypothetical protein DICVIV_06315 [Dictyocaulus viviparus]|uniref:Uncharacterized protein n=1 Tax=Dictyocaulus viviparus TaxID=29172 RepID=A0A0D8XSH9_DICVI|nr:hypothetical protein DICVIV_06315 [Dictyocaulus viviparus]
MAHNFRKNLISKCIRDCGTGEFDADLLNEVINGTSDIDIVRLRTYAWRHTIPSMHRVQMYKYMLGISGAYPETRGIVEQHRRDEVSYRKPLFIQIFDQHGRALVLLRCLKTTRSTDYRNDGKSAEPEPTSSDVVKMILLASNHLSKAFAQSLQYIVISAIVRQVWIVCRCDWVDRFCIARSVYSIISEMFDERTIYQEVNGLDTSLKQIAAIDVEIWLKTGCCALLRSERAMQRVMDKLCTGINIVPLAKAIASDYLQSADNYLGHGLMDPGIITMTEDGELRMVNKAIESVLYDTMQKKPARVSENKSRSHS